MRSDVLRVRRGLNGQSRSERVGHEGGWQVSGRGIRSLGSLEVLSLWAVALFAATSGSRGALITYGMEGTIHRIEDPLGLLDFARLGDRVTYTFTFDSDAADTNPTPRLAFYDGLSATVQIGNIPLPSTAPRMEVQQSNLFNVMSYLTAGELSGLVYFRLWDNQNVAIESTAIPLTPYDLSPFEQRYFNFYFQGPQIPPDPYPTDLWISGPMESFYLVPEPLSLFSVSLGLVMLSRRRPLRA